MHDDGRPPGSAPRAETAAQVSASDPDSGGRDADGAGPAPAADEPGPAPGVRLAVRTGADQPWDPEDLAVAEGRDPTPANIERARRELERLGPAAIERVVP